MKRIIGVIFLLPISILLACWGVGFATDILAGNINPVLWINEHRLLIVLVATYFVMKYLNPFKKD